MEIVIWYYAFFFELCSTINFIFMQ